MSIERPYAPTQKGKCVGGFILKAPSYEKIAFSKKHIKTIFMEDQSFVKCNSLYHKQIINFLTFQFK